MIGDGAGGTDLLRAVHDCFGDRGVGHCVPGQNVLPPHLFVKIPTPKDDGIRR